MASSPSPTKGDTSPTAETGASGEEKQDGALAEKSSALAEKTSLARASTQADMLMRAKRQSESVKDLIESTLKDDDVAKDAVRATAPSPRRAWHLCDLESPSAASPAHPACRTLPRRRR